MELWHCNLTDSERERDGTVPYVLHVHPDRPASLHSAVMHNTATKTDNRLHMNGKTCNNLSLTSVIWNDSVHWTIILVVCAC